MNTDGVLNDLTGHSVVNLWISQQNEVTRRQLRIGQKWDRMSPQGTNPGLLIYDFSSPNLVRLVPNVTVQGFLKIIIQYILASQHVL